MNDVALKTQAGREVELSAKDVEQTLRAICTHRPVTQKKPVQQPVAQQLAVA
jgi:hypothetical protein